MLFLPVPRISEAHQSIRCANTLPILFAGKGFYLTYMLILPVVVLGKSPLLVGVAFLLVHLIVGLTVSLVFQTTHTVDSTYFPADRSEFDNGVYHIFATTADYATSNPLVGWLVGGLNHHIAHHLCPFVCHTHYAPLTRIVKETAEEFGISYRQHPTMTRAILHHLILLKQLGNPKQLGKRGLTLPAPVPQSIPVVSRLRSFADSRAMAYNPVQVLSRYTELYGDTFRFYLGGLKEAIVTTNPGVIQHVLKTNAENYQKSEIQVKRMGHFLGKGLLTTHGEAWRTQRRLIQKGFDRKQLEVLSSIMQDSLTDSLRNFDAQARVGPVDIYPQLMKITFSMVARSLFGARLKDEDIDLISHTISTVQEFMVRQTLQPYLNPWFAASGELRRHEDMRARADGVLLEYITRRRHEPPGHDLLQILMDARYSDGEGMSDSLVLSESMQLLVAGHETSSNALSWLLYLLSSRPDCVEKLRQEFDSVLGGAPLTYSDVAKFEFATQVIQEALRLYPPFWMVDRMAVADDRAGDLVIPRGSTVIVFVYGAHHAARHWQSPENFDPERFAKANEKLHTPFAYLPFGAGPRGCIGGNYATLQILMILGAVLRRYDLQLTPGQTIEARPMVILRPKNGIRMTFTEAVARNVGTLSDCLP